MIPRFRPEHTLGDFLFSLSRNTNKSTAVNIFEKQVLQGKATPAALFFNSGRGALFHVLSQLPQKKVFVQAYTGHSVFNAIQISGKQAALLDITLSDFGLDIDQLADRIEKGSIIIATHLYGIPCQIEKIMDIACQKECVVIEDACAALGGVRRGRPLGSFGDIGFFSFDSSKNISACKGGLAIANNPAYSKILEGSKRNEEPLNSFSFNISSIAFGLLVRILTNEYLYGVSLGRLFGSKRPYRDDGSGSFDKSTDSHFKTGLPNFKLGILVSQLKRLHSIVERRRRIVSIYLDRLHEVRGIRLVEIGEGDYPVFMTFPFLLENKERYPVFCSLRRKGIDLGWTFSYVNALDKKECGLLPHATYAAEHMLNLPVYSGLTDNEAARITDAVRTILE
jgi:perosamine synthetase